MGTEVREFLSDFMIDNNKYLFKLTIYFGWGYWFLYFHLLLLFNVNSYVIPKVKVLRRWISSL